MKAKEAAMPTNEVADAPKVATADMARLMELIGGADSVELKMSVPASAQRATIANLPLDPVEAQPRQVFFFDTPELALSQHGVVVRARRIQGGRADTVVKLRPVVPAELPRDLRRSASFNVEVDILPGGFVCSASLKGRATGQEVQDAVGGAMPLRKVFTKEQRAFYRAHAPEGLDLDALTPLGPTFILKATFAPKGASLDRPLVTEMWLYPDGSRILELSTKCQPADTFRVAAAVRSYLASRGVGIDGNQQTKTRTALEFFAAERREQAAAAQEPEAVAEEQAGAAPDLSTAEQA
jgi:hypothetical protein